MNYRKLVYHEFAQDLAYLSEIVNYPQSYTYIFKFSNGYEVKVIKNPFSEGNYEDLFEVIIEEDSFFKGHSKRVIGNQSNEDVLKTLERIKRINIILWTIM